MKKLTDYLVSEHSIDNIKNDVYRNIINTGNKSMISFQNEIETKTYKVEVKIFSHLKSGTIDLVSLDKVISGLQKIYTYSINYKNGNKTLKGKVSNSIREQSKLILNNTYAGSFILEIQRNPNSQLDISELEQNDFYIFDEIFKEYNDFDPENNIKELGYRTFKVLREWYKELDDENLEIAYKNRDSQKEIVMDNETIHSINNKLEEVKEIITETIIQKYGKIIYVDHKNYVINFQTDNELYRIQVIDKGFKNLNINTNIRFKLSFKEKVAKVCDVEVSKKYECNLIDLKFE